MLGCLALSEVPSSYPIQQPPTCGANPAPASQGIGATQLLKLLRELSNPVLTVTQKALLKRTGLPEINIMIVIILIFLLFLGQPLQHMEVLRLRVKSELQLPAYATDTATRNLSTSSTLCCSLQQCRILNPLSEARDQTHILMDTSWVLNLLSHNRNSLSSSLLMNI